MKLKYALVLIVILTAALTACKPKESTIPDSSTKMTFKPYPLQEIESASIISIYDDKEYPLTVNDIADIRIAFNEAFETIQELKQWPDGISPGVVLSMHVNKEQLIQIYQGLEDEQLYVSYIVILKEQQRPSYDYSLQSAKLRETFDALLDR